jgi:hypothetical protein
MEIEVAKDSRGLQGRLHQVESLLDPYLGGICPLIRRLCNGKAVDEDFGAGLGRFGSSQLWYPLERGAAASSETCRILAAVFARLR